MRILLALAAFWFAAVPAHAEWREAETKHFRLYGDLNEKELLKSAERLEALHYLLSIATGVAGDAESAVKVNVFFVGDTSVVERLYGRGGANVAGFYYPSDLGAVAVSPRNAGSDGSFTGQTVLFHEYTHHFMLQYMTAAYPGWFVEGFAELASTASFERKGQITYGKAASHRADELAYLSLYPTRKMVDGSYLQAKRGDPTWGYGQAWALTHYLLLSDKRPGQLRKYMNAINQGRSFAEAATVFGDLDALHREVRIYAEGRSFAYKAPALPATLTADVKFRVLGAAEAALINERIQLERKTREVKYEDKAQTEAAEADRKAWLVALRAKVAKWGRDPYALRLLADAECKAEDYARCLTAADAVLAAVSDDPRALMRKGEAILWLSKDKDGEARVKDIKAARALIVKANRANPDDPLPLVAFYRSYVMEGRQAPAAAIDGLTQAVTTMPQIDDFRLMLARELIDRERKPEAKLWLRPLAYEPHDSGGRQAALRMIAEIDGKKAEGEDAT